MSRLVLEKGEQSAFLNRIYKGKGMSWAKIAELCNICERSLRDWRTEKYNMNFESSLKLSNLTKTQIPKKISVLPEYWSTKKAARKGAVGRYKKYGNPGTSEGRRKGGLVSQAKFKANPEYARSIGVIIRKDIKRPPECMLLAEFIGILLGDGGITKNQVKVSFNRVTDKLYSVYIQKIIKDLFDLSSIIKLNKHDRGGDIIVSSRELVDFLIDKGLKTGCKVRNNADAPKWIFKKNGYKICCLRGLVDTDGSFYPYKHTVNNKEYTNFSMCFTNHSIPLLESAYEILKALGFTPVKSGRHVYLNKKREIDRYFDIIGSSNPKHLKKYKKFGEVPKWS